MLVAFLFALVAVEAADTEQGFKPVSLSHRVYAQKPKLALLGFGLLKFKRTEIHLTLEINGIELEQFEDYSITIVSDDRLQLILSEGKEWWGSSKKMGSLVLKKAVFDASPQNVRGGQTSEIGAEEKHGGGTYEYNIRVASIIPAPTAIENKVLEIMRTETFRLPINGSGFDTRAKIDAFFDPEIDSNMLEVLAHSDTTLYVRLMAGAAWRADEGPLFLKSINTGGGPWKINGDEGIQVAKVIKNHAGKVVESQGNVYQSTPKLTIWGEDFKESTVLRFATGLAKGLNYTQKFTDLGKKGMRLDLELKKGSMWRSSPGILKVMSMIKEEGLAALPLNQGTGAIVADVLQDPEITENKASLDRTHGDLLVIKGAGFSRAELGATKLTFDPPLEMGYDYDLSVKDSKTLHLTLKTGRAWREDVGNLVVTKIDTGAGDFAVNDVIVASIQDDVQAHESGVVVISSPD